MNKIGLCLMLLSFPTIAASHSNIEHYKVSGTTAPELHAEFKAHGPAKDNGIPSPGELLIVPIGEHRVRPYFKVLKHTKNTQSIYKAVKLDAHLIHSHLMPIWVNKKTAKKCLQINWDKMYENLHRHEDKHALLYKPTVAEFKRRAKLRSASSKAALNEKLAGLFRRILLDNQNSVQADFETKTSHGAKDPNYPVVLEACTEKKLPGFQINTE